MGSRVEETPVIPDEPDDSTLVVSCNALGCMTGDRLSGATGCLVVYGSRNGTFPAAWQK
jgi:hypothetical protein